MSSNDEHKSRHLVAVVIFSGIISTIVAVVLVSIRTGVLPSFTLPEFINEQQKSIKELLDSGNPHDALDIIARQPDSILKSDTSLLTQGKTWYLIAWQRYDDDRWKNYAKNPKDWFEGSDVDKAVSCLLRSAQSAETWADATVMLGVVYMEKGWYEKSKNIFQSVLMKDVNHRDAYLYYGVALSRQGKYENAVKYLESRDGYLEDYDFVKNLFYLYLFNLKNYEKAAVLGDLYLKLAPRGDVGIIKVKRELLDLVNIFPEYFNDTMVVIKDRPPEFKPRQR
jgi:tetratricopeptide (TPR) repeat protein